MKHIFTFLAGGLILLSSCSSTQKASQTPDDVYYSPGASKSSAAAENPEYYSTAPSDNYIRLKAEDQDRWSYFDDYNAYDAYYASPVGISPYYGMGYYPYGYGMGMGMGFGYGMGFWDPYMCWNSYFLWNSWYNPYYYNPYYGGVLVSNAKVISSTPYTGIRPFRGSGYSNGLVGGGARFYRPTNLPTTYRPGSRVGSSYRPTNGNSNYNQSGYRPTQSYSQPTRSFTPSSFGGGGSFRAGRH